MTPKAGRITSRIDGLRRRRRVHDVEAGVTYDSRIEAKRAGELRLLALAGEIERLRPHPRFDLIVNGIKVCAYVGDFDYRTRDGRYVVEDVKPVGSRTDPIYRLKRKLMLACLGVNITEVNR